MAFTGRRGEQADTKLEYKRFEIRRGLWLRHKLHRHVCQVKKRVERGWSVFDTKNKDCHHVTEHTLWRYYDPI